MEKQDKEIGIKYMILRKIRGGGFGSCESIKNISENKVKKESKIRRK